MKRTSLIVAGLLALPLEAAAKPLYLTVPRTFGTQESPVVELAFAGKEPVELRVLKPESLESFVKAQANLRRAYEPPEIQLNPARFLSKGLNALRQPGRWLLFSLGSSFREEVAPAFPKRSDVDPTGSGRPVNRLAEGVPKLVGIPPGMTMVRSQWLNLDLGGRQRDFSVPGYDEWGWGGGGFEERRVAIAPLPAGVYVVQVVQGRVEGQVLLVISDLTVQVKQTDGLLLVRVAGRDQLPKSGAKVFAVGASAPKGKELPTAVTDQRGEARLELEDPRVVIGVTLGADAAVVDTDFYSALAVAPDVFIYSDRPIYRPGDECNFRGIVRRPDSFLARLFRPKKREVKVRLIPQQGKEIVSRAEVDEFGAFHGTLKVPEGLDTGVLRLAADLDDQTHQAESRVQQYVKPTFYLELASEQDSVKPGDTIKAKVRARRYSGGVPSKTGYEVFLYRTLLESPAWVDDAGMGGKGSEVTYGSASTTEGMLSVPKRLYSSVAERMEKEVSMKGPEAAQDPWATAPLLDEKGEAEITVTVPPLAEGEERYAFKYSLTVRARDDQKTFANASKSFYLAESEVMGALAPSAKLVMEGAEAGLSVRATSLAGRAYGETQGEVALALEKADGTEVALETKPFKTGADGIWRGALPTRDVGTVIARVTLTDQRGKPWKGEASMMVASKGGEPVARVPVLTADAMAGVLEPDDTAQVVALFPESWGPGGKNKGPVWVTLSGSGVYDTKLLDFSGSTLVHAFEIERRFGSAVYASIAYPTATGRWEERTVPFRIIPRERTLRVSVEPVKPEAAPLGPQTIRLRVADHRGNGVQAQLSVGVVDKAVYAIQSELRPGVLEFFYPIGRNNVMSFYSSEFQGYGYGEQLARAGSFKLHAFAGVKPPTKRAKDQERDTAYWNPAVVTDRDGAATVTFTLPSNQTLWTVTAVAADASGRFGEQTAEFASRGEMALVASLPQFLRAGDEATGSVRISRGAEGDEKTTYQVAIAPSQGVQGDTKSENVQLVKGGEQVVPFALKAPEAGRGGVSIKVTGGANPLSDQKNLMVRKGAIEETLVASAWGGGVVEVPVPPGGSVESAELVLQPSSVDAALTGVHELLDYPYGCLEQLVSTTMPNVALYQTLDRIGALSKLDPESRALLAEARSRAAQGIERILALAVKGGGFTWFSGYTKPEVPQTLIALDGLAYAVEAKLVEATDPRITESSAWLAAQPELPFELEATRTYVLARLEGPRQAARVRALLEKAPAGDLYALALGVLAAEHAGVSKEPAVTEKIAALAAQASDAALAAYRPSSEDVFWLYPMRRVGMGAILAHATAGAKQDPTAARRKFVEAMSSGSELSTFDRATVLLHNLWLIERDAKEMSAMAPPAVTSDGKVSKPALRPFGLGLTAALDPAARKVTVPSFDGVASVRARVSVPFAAVQPGAQGMSIERAYYVLREGGKKALSAGEEVAQGEMVFVELKVDAHAGERAGSIRSAYYVVEDLVPAGFEPLVEDKEYRGPPFSLPLEHESMKRRSLSPEHATFFFEEPAWWSQSPRVIGYVMRAQFGGKFSAPPATVEDMYASRIKARTAAAQLTVK